MALTHEVEFSKGGAPGDIATVVLRVDPELDEPTTSSTGQEPEMVNDRFVYYRTLTVTYPSVRGFDAAYSLLPSWRHPNDDSFWQQALELLRPTFNIPVVKTFSTND